MKLKNEDAKKLFNTIDIFKITSEQSNFRPISIDIWDDKGELLEDHIDESLKATLEELGKFYYFTPTEDSYELGAINFNEINTHVECEIITLAIKILANLDMYETQVILSSHNEEAIIDNLDSVGVAAAKDTRLESDSKYDIDLSFDILFDGNVIAHGGSNRSKNIAYFKIDYRSIERHVSIDEREENIDILILPEDTSVLDDAFIISTELKDEGFIVETNYHPDIKSEVDANFIIRFDKEDIKNFEVKISGKLLEEEKKIKISSISDELLYM